MVAPSSLSMSTVKGPANPSAGFGIKGGVILGFWINGDAPESFVGDADTLATANRGDRQP